MMRHKTNGIGDYECPICNWEGAVWAAVESRPGYRTRKACPRCGSYPRDRIVWTLLHAYAYKKCGPVLKVVEFGEGGRGYFWKKTAFNYWNVDVDKTCSKVVDVSADQMGNVPELGNADAIVLSYVLSMIRAREARIDLLKRLYQLTAISGRLLLFDDLALELKRHVALDGAMFFHRVRFGRAILGEVREAGWHPVVVQSYPEKRILAARELPFIVAARNQQNVGAIEEWITCSFDAEPDRSENREF